MNKKFTFMVAALLAAGGFSANAALDVTKLSENELVNGKIYYVVSDVATTDGTLESGDYYIGANPTQATGNVMDILNVVAEGAEDLPTNVKNNPKYYQWQVNLTEY